MMIRLLFVAMALAALQGCGGPASIAEARNNAGGNDSSSGSSGSGSDTTNNSAPTANAGPDVSGTRNTGIVLDASQSSDPDGDTLSFDWTVISGPDGGSVGTDGTNFRFSADLPGEYEVQLVVSDGIDRSDPDTVIVTVTNVAPTASAGPDVNVQSGRATSITATGADDDGDNLSYSWSLLSGPTGSTATLTNADSASASLLADDRGLYVLSVEVSDGVESATDQVEVTIVDHGLLAETLAVGNLPTAGALADVDGDGQLDIIVVNSASNTVSVFQAGSGGAYGIADSVSVGVSPLGIAVADIDADGFDDWVTSDFGEGSLSVSYGATSGSTNAETIAAAIGVADVALADVNGDDLLDIVTLNIIDGNISLFAGTGLREFAGATLVTTLSGAAAMAVADVNDDGVPDLSVSSNTDRTVTTFAGDGTGGFSLLATATTATTPGAIAAAPIDADGDVDLVVVSSDSDKLLLVPGTGLATFMAVPSVVGGEDIAAAMVSDGDRADVIVASFGLNAVALHGNEGGTLAAPGLVYAGNTPSSIAVADIDSDGAVDMLVTNYAEGEVSLLRGRDLRTQVTPEQVSAADVVAALTVADIDDDGRGEMIAAYPLSDQIGVLSSDGTEVLASVGSLPQAVASGDINGDSLADVIVANSGDDTVSILLAPDMTETTLAVGMQPEQVFGTDVDGDGDLDVVALNVLSGDVTVLAGSGAGSFDGGLTSALGGSYLDAGLLDVDGDGDLDLVLGDVGTNEIVLSLSGGDGAYGAATSIASLVSPMHIETGDLDGDGQFEILVASPGGMVTVLQGQDSSFDVEVAFTTGIEIADMLVTDINADGNDDLVVSSSERGDVLLFVSDGTLDLDEVPVRRAMTSAASTSVAVGDIDGDGALDITSGAMSTVELIRAR